MFKRYRTVFVLLLFGFVLALLGALLSINHNSELETMRRQAWQNANLTSRTADAKRGEWVARAGGCIACHTDTKQGGKLLAGGTSIETPFGQFIAPNITSDPQVGIGAWTRENLAEALFNGRAPDGTNYWPALPYTAYGSMTAQDLTDLHAWLLSSEPVPIAASKHTLWVPDIGRSTLGVWKARYMNIDNLHDLPMSKETYLVEALGHCAECHAARDIFGGIVDRSLSGNSRGPAGVQVPNITQSALSAWSIEDLVFYLEIGMTPEGDFSGAHMAQVIEHGTSHLSVADRESIARYLKSNKNE